MKTLFIICKVLFIICTVLFALLSFVDIKCIIFAVICLVLSILIKPTKMAQNYKDKQSKSGTNLQHQQEESSPEIIIAPTPTTTSTTVPLTKHGQAKQRIAENRAAGVACCPKCGSTSLSANKKGFSLGKAAAGAFVAGPVGLLGGTMGANKLEVTCLNCGHKYRPGTK